MDASSAVEPVYGEGWFPNRPPKHRGPGPYGAPRTRRSPMTAPLVSAAGSISGRTALVGVLGDPVRHSLSPAMHNAALRQLGLDWVYLALPTPAASLATVLNAMEALGCRGLNVTIPHKQAVAALCRELSPLAQRLGAVNTLVPHPGGGWFGTNTDVEGFLAPLRASARPGPAGASWADQQALVLGCGGSARAVVAALVELGLGRITLVGRQAGKLAACLTACRDWAPQLETLAWPYQGGGFSDDGSSDDSPGGDSRGDELIQALATAQLVVNTTPLGMAAAGDPQARELSPLQPRQLEALAPGSCVYDLIYTPRPTLLLRQAVARGCQGLDGLEMLVQQGAAALGLWSGVKELPVAAMRAAALEQLQRRP
jgi:shikimate dehydrogenase